MALFKKTFVFTGGEITGSFLLSVGYLPGAHETWCPVYTRIARLKDDLQHIERTRLTQRKSRSAVYTVALVGYTNAGKSTLFNRLTRGGAEAIDKLFATLDSRTQRIAYEMPRETVIVDTVGFIRKLPHHLVASFRSTMEEAVAADLVLHVIDGSHPQFEEQETVGEQVLADLGVDPGIILEVYNKFDLAQSSQHWFPEPRQRSNAVAVSALTGNGIERLLEMIRDRELAGGDVMHLEIPHHESRLAARLHEVAQIHEQKQGDGATLFTAWVPREFMHLFEPYSAAALLKSTRVSRAV